MVMLSSPGLPDPSARGCSLRQRQDCQAAAGSQVWTQCPCPGESQWWVVGLCGGSGHACVNSVPMPWWVTVVGCGSSWWLRTVFVWTQCPCPGESRWWVHGSLWWLRTLWWLLVCGGQEHACVNPVPVPWWDTFGCRGSLCWLRTYLSEPNVHALVRHIRVSWVFTVVEDMLVWTWCPCPGESQWWVVGLCAGWGLCGVWRIACVNLMSMP